MTTNPQEVKLPPKEPMNNDWIKRFKEIIKEVDCCLGGEIYFTLYDVREDLGVLKQFLAKELSQAYTMGVEAERERIVSIIKNQDAWQNRLVIKHLLLEKIESSHHISKDLDA